MKKQTVYLDTSVIGGCFDKEFQTWSNGIINDIENGFYKGATSKIVMAELSMAPLNVKQKYEYLLDLGLETYETNKDVEFLLDAYLDRGILSDRFINDMTHIALATVHHADILVSWNFKHIVHYDKITKFNAVNLEYGFRQLTILSPREVTTYE